MWESWWVQGGTAFVGAVLLGTLVEYVVHRLMHGRLLLGKKHAEHHRDGWGQGFAGEFWDYFIGTAVLLWLGFLYSLPFGIGWVAGGVFFACFAAYSHQVQHDRPELVFWMRQPVHYIHHRDHMWRHNFGISVDWWDRIFGTYKAAEWKPEKGPFSHGFKAFFQIKWW